MRQRIIIVLLFFFCCEMTFSQRRTIDSLKNVLSVSKEDTNKIKTLHKLYGEYILVRDLDSSMLYAAQSLELSKKLKHKKAIGNSFMIVAWVFYCRYDFERARSNYYAAIKVWQEINEIKRISTAYDAIVQSYFDEDNYPEAIKIIYLQLRTLEQQKDSLGMIGALYSLSRAQIDFGSKTEGLRTAKQARHLAEEKKDESKVVFGHYIEAYTYVELDSLQQAESSAIIAKDKFEKIGDLYWISVVNVVFGKIHLKRGERYLLSGDRVAAKKEYDTSIQYCMLAYKVFKKDHPNHHGIVNATIILGKAWHHQKNYSRAREFLNECLRTSLSMKNKFEARDSYQWLAKTDSATGDFQNAFKNYKSYILYRDSIVNEEGTRKSTQLKLQYEFDKKEDSLKQKQILTQTSLDSQKKQKNFYLAGAGMLALLSVFVFLNFRNQKKINRLANDAHAKEKAELELQSLRAQLNPHFMFNSLNAIQELILLEQNEKSQSYLARFAKLLRLLLENADKPFIALQREIDFLQLYLSLENLRIPDLQFSITVDPNINTETTQIPNMILQPYIENAIWHGLSHKEKDRRLQIRINNENGFTKYEVEDNGVGRKRSAELKSLYRKEHRSKGMELLSKRFRLLAKEYGAEVETIITDVVSENESGTIVMIKVPNKIKSI